MIRGVILAAVLVFGAVSPLSESQKTRVETAKDLSPSLDEAAFYALLENAADWPGSEGGAEALIPGYGQLANLPAENRGKLCLVEGRIYQVVTPNLSRSGWSGVRGITIRINEAQDPPTAKDFVIVYLTDPPNFKWRNEREQTPLEYGERVRVLARFYKPATFTSRGGDDRAAKPATDKTYLTFVGKSVTSITPLVVVDYEGAGSTRNIGIAAIIVLVAAYLFFRFSRLRATQSAAPRVSKMEHYRQEKEAERAKAAQENPPPPPPANLPADPGAALEVLGQSSDPNNLDQ
jgi:hypothetical protein